MLIRVTLLGLTFWALMAFLAMPAQGCPLPPFPIRPNIEMTPGKLCSKTDKDYTELRYKYKMPYCGRNVPQSLKKRIFTAYGIVDPSQQKHYTIDHLIPLSIGGNNSIENLWPEPRLVRLMRNLEQELYNKVSTGKMTPVDAQKEVLTNKREFTIFRFGYSYLSP